MRIVMCDDHRLFLEAMATALAGMGYVVEAATTTPEEALAAVAAYDPDALLIDVMFPEESGLDVAREVLTRHPRTRVVMITGADAVEPLVRALEIGVSGYALKNQRVEAIADVLDAAVRGEVSFDRTLLRRVSTATPAVPRQRTPLDELTPREQFVLRLLGEGMNTHQIEQRLGVSQSTVRTHVQNILSKLGVHSRLQAVAALSADGGHAGLDLVHAAPE